MHGHSSSEQATQTKQDFVHRFRESPQGTSSERRRRWCAAYRAAMLEPVAEKAARMIESASEAIQLRMAELESDSPAVANEPEDLRSALRYLTMLRDCFGTEKEPLLWC